MQALPEYTLLRVVNKIYKYGKISRVITDSHRSNIEAKQPFQWMMSQQKVIASVEQQRADIYINMH